WSRDGRYLLFRSVGPKTGSDIWFLPMNGETSASIRPEVYLKTPFTEVDAKFSPDGRFVAYVSEASGTPEVYVQPAGGSRPVWRRDGKELFYLGPGNARLFAVEVTLSPVFKAGIPKALFDFPPGPVSYDVSADGQKFIKLAVPADTPDASAITIVLN